MLSALRRAPCPAGAQPSRLGPGLQAGPAPASPARARPHLGLARLGPCATAEPACGTAGPARALADMLGRGGAARPAPAQPRARNPISRAGITAAPPGPSGRHHRSAGHARPAAGRSEPAAAHTPRLAAPSGAGELERGALARGPGAAMAVRVRIPAPCAPVGRPDAGHRARRASGACPVVWGIGLAAGWCRAAGVLLPVVAMVPPARLELATYALRMRRSTG